MNGCSFVEVRLEALERCAIYLESLEVMRNRQAYALCREFEGKLAEALRSDLRIRIISPDAEDMAPKDQWRLPLAEAPEPWRSQAEKAIRFYAARSGAPLRPERIDYVF